MSYYKTYSIVSRVYGGGSSALVTWSDKALTWEHSPKSARGKLLLQQNAHLRAYETITGLTWTTGYAFYTLPKQCGTATYYGVPNVLAGGDPRMVPYRNEAYARMRGKIYKGNASLGVTVAQWRQSHDIILDRYKQLTLRADRWAKSLSSQSRSKQLAGFHLEVIFGWVPLVSDIHAAASTVIQNAVPRHHISAKADFSGTAKTVEAGDYGVVWTDTTFKGRVVYSATVEISNPNLWLAERAGSLNFAAVAWDSVPWSFVVNMFVNTGQLVGSITDYAGLTFMGFTGTEACDLFSDVSVSGYPPDGGTGKSFHIRRDKRRYDASLPPKPNLQFKIPNADWDTVAMAASLFVQKFSKLAKFIS